MEQEIQIPIENKVKSKRVPKLRFEEFDGEWKENRLGKICSTFKSGSNITSEKIFDNGVYPVYGGNGLRGYTDSFTHDGFYFLIGRQGALCGNINRVVGKTFVSEHAIAVEANHTSDTEWLAQKLDKLNLNRLSESSAQPGLAVGKLVRLKLNTPSLPEQQKIANFLSAVDDKIQQLTRKKEFLETYKKGVMQQLLSQQLRFKDENGKDFSEWENKKIGKILKIGSGRDYKHLKAGKIPVYGTGGLMTFVNSYLYDGDSVGIGRKGTIDKPVFLKGKFWTVDTLFYTHSFDLVLPKFVFCIFQQINWKKHNEASGVPSLSKTTIEKIKIPLPSLKEQQKIADFLSAIDVKIEAVSQQIAKTQSFKKGLLQQMFV